MTDADRSAGWARDTEAPVGARWRWGHSIWMLWLLPFGFTSFIGIAYAGIRTRQRPWVAAAVLYAVPPIALIASPSGSAMRNVFTWACLGVGLVALAHGVRGRSRYLELLAAQKATRPTRPQSYSSPARAESVRRITRRRLSDLDIAADRLREANQTAEARVGAAAKALRAAIAKREAEIRAAEKAIEQAPRQRKLAGGRLSRVTLYDESIKLPKGTKPLTPTTTAVVDTAGNLMTTRRYTLTRFALLGVFSVFAPKKTHDDKRELYLLVEDQTWAEVVKFPPDKGKEAREIAQQIKLAAGRIDEARRARQTRVANAKTRLEEAMTDRSEILAAQANVRTAAQAIDDVATARNELAPLLATSAPRPDKRAVVAIEEADRILTRAEAARESEAQASGEERLLDERSAGEVSQAANAPVPPVPRSDTPLEHAPAPANPLVDPQEKGECATSTRDAEPTPKGTGELSSDPEGRRANHPELPATDDPLQTLTRLSELHKQGVLTAEEFLAAKSELLKRL